MSDQPKGRPGSVRDALQQLSPEERDRLVKALAAALVDEIRDRQRFDAMRKVR